MARILVVPIYVDALVLDTATQVVEAFEDFSRLPYFDGQHGINANFPYVSENILLKPFQDPNLCLEPGIHLHWALPDALTKATQAQDGKFEFPLVPNRWLVTRNWKGRKEQWVVESDYIEAEKPSSEQRPTIPYLADSKHPYRYLGRCLPLVDWLKEIANPKNRYLDGLTAMGFDEPAFAAFYPNAQSVFGFYENNWGRLDRLLSEINTVSYEVLGWYADSQQDYLAQWTQQFQHANHRKPSVEEQAGALQGLNGWAFQNDSQEIPEKMVCYGRIHFNAPKDAGGKLLLRPSLNKNDRVELAFGSTTTEALSAFLASQVDADRKANIEDQLEALHLASSLKRQHIDLGPKFLEARHTKGFRPVSAGSLWTLKTENRPNSPGASPIGDKQPPVSLPVELAELLNALNNSQQAYDRAVFELESLRQQLFADWYTFMLCAYPALDLTRKYPRSEDVKRFIEENDLAPLSLKAAAVGELMIGQRDCSGQPILESRPGETLAARVAKAGNALLDSDAMCGLQRIVDGDIQDWNGWMAKLRQAAFLALDPNLLSAKEPADKKTRAAAVLEALNQRIARQDFYRDFVQHPPEPSVSLKAVMDILLQLSQLPAGAPRHIWMRLNRLVFELLFPEHIAHRPALILQEIHAPRYWEPDDPSILLAGDVVRPTGRYGAHGVLHQDGLLPCKVLPLQTLEPGGSVPKDGLSQAADLVRSMMRREQYSASKRPGAKDIGDAIRLLESTTGLTIWNEPTPSLTIPDLSPIRSAITLLLSLDTSAPGRPVRDVLRRTLQALESIRAPWKAGLSNPAAQMLAAVCAASRLLEAPFGAQTWQEQPWNPILLEWELDFDPLHQQDFIAGQFRLPENSPDFQQFNTGSHEPAPALTHRYSGRCILTPHAKNQLMLHLAAYLKNTSPSEVGELPADLVKAQTILQNTHILAQSLGGFNQALLMQRQTFQLPILDPANTGRQAFTKRVSDLVGQGSRAAPQPSSDFTPIRAGRAKIHRLRLIDTFGQVQYLAIENQVVAAAENMPLEGQGVILFPRLAQPARLNFRWLAASGGPGENDDLEMNDHPTTSPVCGWIMINPLDRSLMLFDQSGSALGSIDPSGSWHTAPQHQPITIREIPNPHLRKIAGHLSNHGKRLLPHFLDVIETALENIYPESSVVNDALAVLLGRPIAVVRASLNLELRGRPAVSQEWDAFQQDLRQTRIKPDAQGIHHLVRACGDFTKVAFPIRVGEHLQMNDGLIGYWVEEGEDYADGHFYAPQAAANGPAGHPDSPAIIRQSIDDPPHKLTLLLDPRSVVHATCGVLPVKSIQIPPEQYVEALSAIEMTYLVAPLLTSTGSIDLPLPEEPGYEWSWLEKAHGILKDNTPDDTIPGQPSLQATFAAKQELREGWLRLKKSPSSQNGNSEQERSA